MTRRSTPTRPPERHDRLIREREHDAYKVRGKLPDPTACPECGAMYRNGRWLWAVAPSDAHQTLCPACHRVRDGDPAGEVLLSGSFASRHREELVGVAKNVEEREARDHPLKRIMQVSDDASGLLITTTAPGLARSIGDAVHRAYSGELDYRYGAEEQFLRVHWSRDD